MFTTGSRCWRRRQIDWMEHVRSLASDYQIEISNVPGFPCARRSCITLSTNVRLSVVFRVTTSSRLLVCLKNAYCASKRPASKASPKGRVPAKPHTTCGMFGLRKADDHEISRRSLAPAALSRETQSRGQSGRHSKNPKHQRPAAYDGTKELIMDRGRMRQYHLS